MTILLVITSLNIIARNKQEDPHFKNLKILPKDISEEKLKLEMQLISKSLGVKCGFCHIKVEDKWDFASDEKKHKLQARDMMLMTNDLNEKYFGADLKNAKPTDLAINCYTCHRGEEEPVVPWDTLHVLPKHAPPPPPSAPSTPAAPPAHQH